jgi:hypothetical protein
VPDRDVTEGSLLVWWKAPEQGGRHNITYICGERRWNPVKRLSLQLFEVFMWRQALKVILRHITTSFFVISQLSSSLLGAQIKLFHGVNRVKASKKPLGRRLGWPAKPLRNAVDERGRLTRGSDRLS